jgi:TorA maturation chaperone TorD
MEIHMLPDTLAVDLARECLYRFLATAFRDPKCPVWSSLLLSDNQRIVAQANELLSGELACGDIPLGLGELPPRELNLQRLFAEMEGSIDKQVAEYDRVFGLVTAKECPPYETEYYPPKESFQRAQQLADIAGFYRAFGLEPSAASPERPDHIALELEFMSFLQMKKRLALASISTTPEDSEQAMICEDAARKFFATHLCWWVPAFATSLRHKAAGGFYGELAKALAAWLPAERTRWGVAAARMPLRADLIERPEEEAACAECAG